MKSKNKNSSSDSGTKGSNINSCEPSTSTLRNPRLDTTSNQSTIASRTRSRLRTVPTVLAISETDESSTEVSRPPIQRLHHSTLPTPLLPPKRPVGRPRKHLTPEPETRKNQNIHVETRIVSVELSSVSDDSEDSVLEEPIHSSINITQPKQSSETLVLPQETDPAEVSRTDNIPVLLQESFHKFDESLRILEEKFQSNEKAVMETEKLIEAISEGESVEEDIQNLLKDLDPYDDDHGDKELARRIDKLSQSIPEISESELLRRVSLSADEIARCKGNTTPSKSNVNERENTKQRGDSASNTVTAARSAIRPGETERFRREIRISLPGVGIMPTARSTPLVT